MPAEQLKELKLSVRTGNEAAEIFIIDSQFQRVATSIGQKAEFKLQPGLYSVKVRVGSEYEEKSVALLTKNELVNFGPIQFSTAAPLSGTAQTHDTQIDNAVAQSIQVHEYLGEGSQVYIFARNWTEKDAPPTNYPLQQHPARGLTLRNSADEILVDFGSPGVGAYTSGTDPWSACNVQLDPGVYCLCLVTNSGQMIRQSVVASPDWQTQVFLLQGNYNARENDIHADLSNGSIFMSRIGHGFQSSKPYKHSKDPDFHLTEMARQALINNRPALGQELLSRMLKQKFTNPMLGIYAAHLLLLDDKADKSILPAVIKKLRDLLTNPHPDIEAIAQKIKLPGNYIFSMPPMLHISWNYVLEASVTQPGIVPENSVASTIAGEAWSGSPWLLWGHSASGADNTGILSGLLKKLTKLELSAVDTSNLAPDELMATKMELPVTENLGLQPASPSGEAVAPKGNILPEMDDEQMLHLVLALGIPRLKLEALIKNIKVN
ncbi:MAG: hypothetical protein ABIQ31_17045 [Ferruginibacter sp.]